MRTSLPRTTPSFVFSMKMPSSLESRTLSTIRAAFDS
jgi:hypothetical protein